LVKGLIASLAIFLIFGTISSAPGSENSSALTANVLNTHSPQRLVSSQAPFDVEFVGKEALSYSNCGAFLRENQISIKWSTSQNSVTDSAGANVPGLTSYPEGNFYKTLGMTQSGIKCQLGHVVGWGNGDLFEDINSAFGWPKALYSFEKGQNSVELLIQIFSRGTEIGRSSGLLYNPIQTLPYEITYDGISRGSEVSSYFEFSIAGSIPPTADILSSLAYINEDLCGSDSLPYCKLVKLGNSRFGIVILDLYHDEEDLFGPIDFEFLFVVDDGLGGTSPVSAGKVVLNRATNSARIESAKLATAGLFLNANVSCSNPRAGSGTKLRCKVFPTVTTSPDKIIESTGDVASQVKLEIQVKTNSGKWLKLKSLVALTDKYTNFELLAPKVNFQYLAIRAVNTSFRSGIYQPQTYGRAPGDYNNNLVLKTSILWGQYHQVSVRPIGGKASSCVIYDGDQRTVLGRIQLVNGKGTARIRQYWASAIGGQKVVVVYAACKYKSVTYWDYSTTIGIR